MTITIWRLLLIERFCLSCLFTFLFRLKQQQQITNNNNNNKRIKKAKCCKRKMMIDSHSQE